MSLPFCGKWQKFMDITALPGKNECLRRQGKIHQKIEKIRTALQFLQ